MREPSFIKFKNDLYTLEVRTNFRIIHIKWKTKNFINNLSLQINNKRDVILNSIKRCGFPLYSF